MTRDPLPGRSEWEWDVGAQRFRLRCAKRDYTPRVLGLRFQPSSNSCRYFWACRKEVVYVRWPSSISQEL